MRGIVSLPTDALGEFRLDLTITHYQLKVLSENGGEGHVVSLSNETYSFKWKLTMAGMF